jgi:hypothetical protein
MNRVRNVWWKIEAFFAGLFAVGALVTAVVPQWIEEFGLEPDGGSGSAEWGIVAVLGVVALTAGLLSRRHFVVRARRLAAEKGSLP